MLFLLLAAVASARLLHSLPEDTYAFPKYNVLFLNNLPLLNHTAHHWLHNPPSLSEFLGLESGDTSQSSQLELLKMGRDSYLCLIPEPLHLPPPPEEVQDESALTPAHSWSLLQPLTGTCLYVCFFLHFLQQLISSIVKHRQGWFTYSYCHNDQIRQFKELIQPHSHIPGDFSPLCTHFACLSPSLFQRKTPRHVFTLLFCSICLINLSLYFQWESYTLGKAPTTETDLSVSQQQNENSNALQLARGGGSRYLVQTWADGTICDKTGKSREVEVQVRHVSLPH